LFSACVVNANEKFFLFCHDHKNQWAPHPKGRGLIALGLHKKSKLFRFPKILDFQDWDAENRNIHPWDKAHSFLFSS